MIDSTVNRQKSSSPAQAHDDDMYIVEKKVGQSNLNGHSISENQCSQREMLALEDACPVFNEKPSLRNRRFANIDQPSIHPKPFIKSGATGGAGKAEDQPQVNAANHRQDEKKQDIRSSSRAGEGASVNGKADDHESDSAELNDGATAESDEHTDNAGNSWQRGNSKDANNKAGGTAGPVRAASANRVVAGFAGMVGSTAVRAIRGAVDLGNPFNCATTVVQHAPALLSSVADNDSPAATLAKYSAMAMTGAGIATSLCAAASATSAISAAAILGICGTRLVGQTVTHTAVRYLLCPQLPDSVREYAAPWLHAGIEIALAATSPMHTRTPDGTDYFTWLWPGGKAACTPELCVAQTMGKTLVSVPSPELADLPPAGSVPVTPYNEKEFINGLEFMNGVKIFNSNGSACITANRINGCFEPGEPLSIWSATRTGSGDSASDGAPVVTAQNLVVNFAAPPLQPSKINEDFSENVFLPPKNEQLPPVDVTAVGLFSDGPLNALFTFLDSVDQHLRFPVAGAIPIIENINTTVEESLVSELPRRHQRHRNKSVITPPHNASGSLSTESAPGNITSAPTYWNSTLSAPAVTETDITNHEASPVELAGTLLKLHNPASQIPPFDKNHPNITVTEQEYEYSRLVVGLLQLRFAEVEDYQRPFGFVPVLSNAHGNTTDIEYRAIPFAHVSVQDVNDLAKEDPTIEKYGLVQKHKTLARQLGATCYQSSLWDRLLYPADHLTPTNTINGVIAGCYRFMPGRGYQLEELSLTYQEVLTGECQNRACPLVIDLLQKGGVTALELPVLADQHADTEYYLQWEPEPNNRVVDDSRSFSVSSFAGLSPDDGLSVLLKAIPYNTNAEALEVKEWQTILLSDAADQQMDELTASSPYLHHGSPCHSVAEHTFYDPYRSYDPARTPEWNLTFSNNRNSVPGDQLKKVPQVMAIKFEQSQGGAVIIEDHPLLLSAMNNLIDNQPVLHTTINNIVTFISSIFYTEQIPDLFATLKTYLLNKRQEGLGSAPALTRFISEFTQLCEQERRNVTLLPRHRLAAYLEKVQSESGSSNLTLSDKIWVGRPCKEMHLLTPYPLEEVLSGALSDYRPAQLILPHSLENFRASFVNEAFADSVNAFGAREPSVLTTPMPTRHEQPTVTDDQDRYSSTRNPLPITNTVENIQPTPVPAINSEPSQFTDVENNPLLLTGINNIVDFIASCSYVAPISDLFQTFEAYLDKYTMTFDSNQKFNGFLTEFRNTSRQQRRYVDLASQKALNGYLELLQPEGGHGNLTLSDNVWVTNPCDDVHLLTPYQLKEVLSGALSGYDPEQLILPESLEDFRTVFTHEQFVEIIREAYPRLNGTQGTFSDYYRKFKQYSIAEKKTVVLKHEDQLRGYLNILQTDSETHCKTTDESREPLRLSDKVFVRSEYDNVALLIPYNLKEVLSGVLSKYLRKDIKDFPSAVRGGPADKQPLKNLKDRDNSNPLDALEDFTQFLQAGIDKINPNDPLQPLDRGKDFLEDALNDAVRPGYDHEQFILPPQLEKYRALLAQKDFQDIIHQAYLAHCDVDSIKANKAPREVLVQCMHFSESLQDNLYFISAINQIVDDVVKYDPDLYAVVAQRLLEKGGTRFYTRDQLNQYLTDLQALAETMKQREIGSLIEAGEITIEKNLTPVELTGIMKLFENDVNRLLQMGDDSIWHRSEMDGLNLLIGYSLEEAFTGRLIGYKVESLIAPPNMEPYLALFTKKSGPDIIRNTYRLDLLDSALQPISGMLEVVTFPNILITKLINTTASEAGLTTDVDELSIVGTGCIETTITKQSKVAKYSGMSIVHFIALAFPDKETIGEQYDVTAYELLISTIFNIEPIVKIKDISGSKAINICDIDNDDYQITPKDLYRSQEGVNFINGLDNIDFKAYVDNYLQSPSVKKPLSQGIADVMRINFERSPPSYSKLPTGSRIMQLEKLRFSNSVDLIGRESFHPFIVTCKVIDIYAQIQRHYYSFLTGHSYVVDLPLFDSHIDFSLAPHYKDGYNDDVKDWLIANGGGAYDITYHGFSFSHYTGGVDNFVADSFWNAAAGTVSAIKSTVYNYEQLYIDAVAGSESTEESSKRGYIFDIAREFANVVAFIPEVGTALDFFAQTFLYELQKRLENDPEIIKELTKEELITDGVIVGSAIFAEVAVPIAKKAIRLAAKKFMSTELAESLSRFAKRTFRSVEDMSPEEAEALVTSTKKFKMMDGLPNQELNSEGNQISREIQPDSIEFNLECGAARRRRSPTGGACALPDVKKEVFQSKNLRFVTKEEGHLPELHFSSKEYGNGRLSVIDSETETIHPHKKDAFFKSKEDSLRFHQKVNELNQQDALTADNFSRLRTEYGGISKPKQGFYHVEAGFDSDSSMAKGLTTRASDGAVITGNQLKPYAENLPSISRSMKETAGVKSIEYSEITGNQLESRMRLNKESVEGVCYEAAYCVSKLEGSLNDEQIGVLKKSQAYDDGYAYTKEYKTLLGLEDVNLNRKIAPSASSEFNLNDIDKSGFISIKRDADDEFFHTMFVQKTSGGKTYIYQTNDPVLTKYFVDSGGSYTQIGTITRFELSEDTIIGFNQYLTDGGYQFGYSRSPDIASRIPA